eukprot:365933-Chlamydomonas_euryale.AAC.2
MPVLGPLAVTLPVHVQKQGGRQIPPPRDSLSLASVKQPSATNVVERGIMLVPSTQGTSVVPCVEGKIETHQQLHARWSKIFPDT